MQEKDAKYTVTQKMYEIGVERKGCYQSKNLGVVENGIGVSRPLDEP